MAGYAFAKLRFRGRDAIFRLLLGALVIPGQVAMLPLFLMLKPMGLINTYGGAMVPALASIFGIFLVRQFARGIPDELLEAARIDGAGELRIFTTVVVPLLKPIVATLAVFSFLAPGTTSCGRSSFSPTTPCTRFRSRWPACRASTCRTTS